MSGSVFAESVLILKTDRSQLRSGFAAARAEATRETLRISNESKVELRAKLDKLRADFNATERAARDASAKIGRAAAFDIRAKSDQLRSDLRMAEREHAASLRRMEQETRRVGGDGGLFGAVLTGVGIGSGAQLVQSAIGLVGQALDAGKQALFGYNAAIETSNNLIKGFTGSQEAVARAQDLANQQVARGRGAYSETLAALAELTPLANKYRVSLEDLLRITQLLAAADPVQGLEGARIAIREALSGDFTSFTRRFEASRSEIAKLRAEGVPNLEVIERTLASLGVTERLLDAQAGSGVQRLRIAIDEAKRLAAQVGQPLYQGASDLLGGALGALRAPETQRAARELAADVKIAVDDIRKFLSSPELKEAAQTFAALIGRAWKDARDMGASIRHELGPAFAMLPQAINTSVQSLKDFEDWLNRTNEAISGKGVDLNLKIRELGLSFAQLKFIVNAKAGSLSVEELRAWRDEINGMAADIERRKAELASGRSGEEPFVPKRSPLTGPEATGTPDSPSALPSIGGGAAAGARIVANVLPSPAELYRQGQADIQRYLAGFQPQDFDLFGDLKPQIDASFERAFGDLSLEEQFVKGGGNLDVITARIVDDIRTIGHVSGETEAIVRATFGDQADAVLDAANAYGVYREKQEAVARATDELKSAQDALTEAQRIAQRHQEELRESIQGLQDDLAALNEEAADAARGYADRIDDLQEALAAFQRQSEDAQRGYADRIGALQRAAAAAQRAAEDAQRDFQRQIADAQAEQQAAQEAATRNAAAYQAVLNGTTEEYRRQNQELSDQERQILALGDAALNAALKAKTAQDDKVVGLEAQQRAALLGYEERIRGARNKRTPEGEREARALEAERDRLRARSEYELQLERQRAAVRGDQVAEAKRPIEAAAAAQAEADKGRVDAAGKRVSEIQAQAQARAEADRAAAQAMQDQIAAVQEEARLRAESDRAQAQAMQDRITAVQREAKEVADDYAARGRAIQDTIDKEEERGRVIAATDKKAIEDAQTRVNNAKTVKDNADLELIAQGKIVDALAAQNTILDTRFKAWKDFYENVLKPAGQIMADFANGAPPIPPSVGPGGAQGGGRDARAGAGEASGAPAPGETPPPGVGPGPMPPSYPSSNLRIADLPFARATFTPAAGRAPTPVVPSFASGGGLAFARAGGAPGGATMVLQGPLLNFQGATIRETVEIQRAALLALETLERAYEQDDAGGGALSRWGN